jgi:cytochrome o ubiquinol oxidase subunit 2
MNNRYKKYIITFLNIAVLDPKGIIAHQERSLMITAILLMLIVVIPVFVLTAMFAYKYRAGNKSAKYAPNWDHNLKTELMMWGIPAAIILVLAVITWKSTHQLDPFKPLTSNIQPLTIQVVALQWKWLFIYPSLNIATVNFVQFPKSTPINFRLTADAPMNSFWIPQLGGQMYAMPGMSTQLHLEASAPGEFAGSAAEISGRGFSGMKFVAKSSTQNDFDNWVQLVKQTRNTLSVGEYINLAKPSSDNPVSYYSSAQNNLFDSVIMKYIMPGMNMSDMMNMSDTDMSQMMMPK